MRNSRIGMLILLLILFYLLRCRQIDHVDVLKGPYLGQKPPGKIAELFAPGLLTAGGNETKISFTPDGLEFAVSISTKGWRYLAEPRGPFNQGFMMQSQMKIDSWTEIKEFSFHPPRLEGYPAFSPDGNKLFFNTRRDRMDPLDKTYTGIAYIEREDGGWSELKHIEFGEDYQGGFGVSPTVALNGNLYFTLWPTNKKGIIHISRYENGKYQMPEQLSDAINKIGGNHPHIAPDESYIIYDWEASSQGESPNDLFISFRDRDGSWMDPVNLGEGVNSHYDERRPFVSFDGKYLFFASTRINPELPDEPISLKELQKLTNVHANGFQHIYWVDASIIEEVKPDHLK